MKPLHKTLLAAALTACAAAVAFTPVRAQSPGGQPVVVTFAGEMSEISCTPSLEGNPVHLPPISVGDVPWIGDTAGDVVFTVIVDCEGLYTGVARKVEAYFYANHVSEGRLNLTGGTGSGWQYQLLPLAHPYYQLDVHTSSTPTAKHPDAPDTGGELMTNTSGTILPYIVRYYRSQNAYNAGTGISTANIVLYWP